jgi:hypothetical protein
MLADCKNNFNLYNQNIKIQVAKSAINASEIYSLQIKLKLKRKFKSGIWSSF